MIQRKKLSIGLIKEGKIPPDTRVALTPSQCAALMQKYPEINIKVQSSAIRCYLDEEYRKAGINVSKDVSDADILLGVKEVNLDKLINNKTYLFFSHTIKKQPYNKKLLKTILKKKIRLVDYERLTDDHDIRVIAFGRWAGIVGAHNGLMTYGMRHGGYSLPRVKDCHNYKALKDIYKTVELPPIRIALTGNGRVAKGCEEVLQSLGVKRVAPEDYLHQSFDVPVYVELHDEHLYYRKSDGAYDQQEFFAKPNLYNTSFDQMLDKTDLMINGIFWNPAAPVFFTRKQMLQPGFSIQTIADITCDIRGSIPSTLRATTIAEPIMGYDPKTDTECEPFTPDSIDVMSVDNLPNELPRDASEAFGQMLIEHVWKELLNSESEMIDRASITVDGHLNHGYEYLSDYAAD